MAGREGRKKSAVAYASNQGVASHLSVGRAVSCTEASIYAAHPAASDRFPYWRAHPIRASGAIACCLDRSTRSLDVAAGRRPRRRTADHFPNAERAYALGPGFCCVCGQPVYRFGWHVDLWGGRTNKNARWHCACVIAWQFWNAPSGEVRLLGGAFKRGVVAKPAAGSGRAPRSTTAGRCFECGANTGTRHGRRCSTIGVSQISR